MERTARTAAGRTVAAAWAAEAAAGGQQQHGQQQHYTRCKCKLKGESRVSLSRSIVLAVRRRRRICSQKHHDLGPN